MCCWCIGEYGSSLLDGSTPQVPEGNDAKPQTAPVVVTEDEVVEVYQQILWANHISVVTKQVIYVGQDYSVPLSRDWDVYHLVSTARLNAIPFNFSML